MRPLPFPVEAAASLLRESGTLATPLLAICMAAYGDDVFGDADKGIEAVDPIELFARLEEDFRAELPEAVENRIQALMMAISTDAFYEDPLVFSSVAAALADGDLGSMPDGILEDLTIPEAMWAIYEVGHCRDDDVALGPQVLQELDAIIRSEAEELGGEVLPHFERFMHDQKLDLASQLAVIGLRLPIAELTATS